MPGKNKVLNRYLEPVLKKLIKKINLFFSLDLAKLEKHFW